MDIVWLEADTSSESRIERVSSLLEVEFIPSDWDGKDRDLLDQIAQVTLEGL